MTVLSDTAINNVLDSFIEKIDYFSYITVSLEMTASNRDCSHKPAIQIALTTHPSLRPDAGRRPKLLSQVD